MPNDPSEASDLPELVARAVTAFETGGSAAVARFCAEHPAHATQILARLEALGAHGLLTAGDEVAHPEWIGSYRVLEELGHGGMGTVYLAEQREPIRRRVALKLIKLGMDSRSVVARFEQERQALALMDHDGIARVFDCGTSQRGQPFFVMELVHGVPIDRFCDLHRLPLADRLRLVQQICSAVQHAHQKGVVHRDLKPGNVLVTATDDEPQVKIIDFGLAKAMGPRLVEATLFTEAGQLVGTPEYMAPEQADPTNPDIDTRADVYSLGVMLYELLVGQLPFAGDELRGAGMLEVTRILREVDPPKPSTKLTSLGDASTAIAKSRGLGVGALKKILRNDLDWVVLKALDKDRNRRYATATALAAELQRFLDDEPLAAGPPSAAYRLQKLLRRYRRQMLAASAVLVTAIVAAVIALGLAFDAMALATENDTLASTRAELATSERAAKEQFAAKVQEFDLLAGIVELERLVAAEQTLHPAWPRQVVAMQRWLDDCENLLAMRADIGATIESLRRLALDLPPEERQRDFAAHPRHAEWQLLGDRIASYRYAQSIRAGDRQFVEVDLPVAFEGLDTHMLGGAAYGYVAPLPTQRTVWGEEALGLAYARRVAGQASRSAREHIVTHVILVYALLANGQDAEADRVWRAVVASANVAEETAHEHQSAITEAAERTSQAIEEALAERDALELEMLTWRFGPEHESAQFLHDALVELLPDLADLESAQRLRVEKRLTWARRIGELSRAHPHARVSWQTVRDALRSSAAYADRPIELRDADAVGLVPLGANPVTGLQEFYHLRSAWDGDADPADLPIPQHCEDGSIDVGEDTGIVFVLLPGGTCRIGATRERDDPNHDPRAEDDEVPVEVELDPFFFARHEMTQAQWARLTQGAARPSDIRSGNGTYAGIDLDTTHPVENVDWSTCDALLTRHGLVLPTEARWEYGCRAGTSSPWACAESELYRFANLADESAKNLNGGTDADPWNDGHMLHAPVGSFAANGFGLHDLHGNVVEWCLDLRSRVRDRFRGGDGFQQQPADRNERVLRGGCFGFKATEARSAARDGAPPASIAPIIGVRAARTARVED